MIVTAMIPTDASEAGDAFERSSRPSPRGFRVLVVDDNEVDRELTIRYLQETWPFEHDLVVETAATGEDALAKLLHQRWTFVLLDWNLPGGDGNEVLRELRQAGVKIPVVVVSGCEYDEVADAIRPHRAGFLNKDHINATQLYQAIAGALLVPA